MLKYLITLCTIFIALSLSTASFSSADNNIEKEFSSTAAELNFITYGDISSSQPFAQQAAQIMNGKGTNNVIAYRSSGCSTGCSNGCSTGCSSGCSMGCSSGCSTGCSYGCSYGCSTGCQP